MSFRHNPYALDLLAPGDRLFSRPPVASTVSAAVVCVFATDACPRSMSAESSLCSLGNSGVATSIALEYDAPLTPKVDCKAAAKTDAVANHYKTRLCKTFKATGSCSYEGFCRFAHGNADLHTYAQNVRAGLVTEEAVREHQEMLAAKAVSVRASKMVNKVTRRA